MVAGQNMKSALAVCLLLLTATLLTDSVAPASASVELVKRKLHILSFHLFS